MKRQNPHARLISGSIPPQSMGIAENHALDEPWFGELVQTYDVDTITG